MRTRIRPLPGLPHYTAIEDEYVPSPLFDKMVLHSTFHLTGLHPGAFDFPGEWARTIAREGLRPNGLAPLDDVVEFPQFTDRRYDGKISFQSRHRVGNLLWLVGIELYFSGVRGWEAEADQRPDSARSMHIGLTVQFNPTRILAHAIKRGIDIDTADWRTLLVSDELTHDALCDLSYNGNDNVLPAQAFVQPGAPFHRISQVVRCLSVVEEFVHYLLVSDRPRIEQRGHSEIELRRQDSWHIRSAEVYQEFRQIAPSASDAVRRMLPALRQIASGLTEQLWTRRERTWQSDESHSPVASYTLRLTELVNLGIYAKTHDRIRLEVRYLNRVPSGGALSLDGRLMALAREASQRINEARRAIVTRLSQLDQPQALGEAIGTLSELSSRLGRFFADAPQRHQRLLEALLTWGAVEAGPTGIIRGVEARQLVRLGILQSGRVANKSRLSNRYALSPRYALLVALFESRVSGE